MPLPIRGGGTITIRKLLGPKPIGLVSRTVDEDDLIGSAEYKNDADWAKRRLRMEVDGTRPSGRPRKIR